MTDGKKKVIKRAADSLDSRDEITKIKAAQEKHEDTLEKIRREQAEKVAAKKAELENKKAEEAAAKAAIVKHVWTNQDTYAELAYKHYGSMKEPYWRLIYEHNKHIIGDHPNHIKTGTEIEIPPLPEELKKK
jgi:nucleoid-associated protein YgaU